MAKSINKRAILPHDPVRDKDKATHLMVIMAVLARNGYKLGDAFDFERGLLDID